jgi:hypothetical protein
MRYRLIKQYPESGLNVGEVITLPDARFKYADENETHCDDSFFDQWPEYFERLSS